MFLFKPHVTGPENNITTPDVLIDRVAVTDDDNLNRVPCQRVTSEQQIQVTAGAYLQAAFTLVAAGGGVLFCPTLLVTATSDQTTISDIVLPRYAWRLKNFSREKSALTAMFTLASNVEQIVVKMKSINWLTQSRGINNELARGVAISCAIGERQAFSNTNQLARLSFTDEEQARSLEQATNLQLVDLDAWPDRPLPRYSVGPVNTTKHYI
jgi:hypothetical protein